MDTRIGARQVARGLAIAAVGLFVLLPGCGGGGGGGGGGGAVSTLALLAGDTGGQGNSDGTGAAARFFFPTGTATDGAGNVYVADATSHTIRKITTAGVVTTFAGTAGLSGSANGTGPAATFNFPRGVATDSLGNVFVADSGNNMIRQIAPGGLVTTLAGTAGQTGSTDATGPNARFSFPSGIAVDVAGNVYVGDFSNNTIRKITPAGVVTTLAGTAPTSGSTDATGAAASFHGPAGLATDAAGNIYVADLSNNTIRQVTSAGVVTTLAGTAGAAGSTNGTGAAARFKSPQGVTADGAGNLYVGDTGNHTVRKIAAGGVVTTLAGLAGSADSTDATGTAARFNGPAGVAVDGAGNVFVVDSFNQSIRKITPAAVVSTFAGTPPLTGSTDATGAAARFNNVFGIAADGAGNAYVADASNHTIRKITPGGVVSTFAGTAGSFGSADGTGALARFNGPQGVATDSAGNVYVSEFSNNTIRKITPAGVVTTLAGTAGVSGSTDATGPAASFRGPGGPATDGAGNVYVADSNNHTIRRITPGGAVSTLAGTAGASGSVDATTTAARFFLPSGVAVDSAGNVYVADTSNHTIRKITPGGVVTTFAGTAGSRGSADGTAAAARFNLPTGIATDAADNVYVADDNNHTIRKITPAGVVSTVVGVAGQADFAPGALPGKLSFPGTIAVSGTSLYITLTNAVVVVQNRP